MENEIIEALNRNTVLLHQAIGLLKDLLQQRVADDYWEDHLTAMETLKMSDSTLCRLRIHHPDQCRKLMGTWYYNTKVLLMFKDKK
jgi:hypothetical protein